MRWIDYFQGETGPRENTYKTDTWGLLNKNLPYNPIIKFNKQQTVPIPLDLPVTFKSLNSNRKPKVYQAFRERQKLKQTNKEKELGGT